MANQEHLDFLLECAEENNCPKWNKWRASNLDLEIDLKGAMLNGFDLSYADLSYADLSYADLSDSLLVNATLCEAKLKEVNLSSANLSNTNLNNADLSKSNLNKAKLNNSDLSHADLSHAILSDVELNEVYLICANLSHADLSLANLSNSRLLEADFSFTILQNSILEKVDLQDAILTGANLHSANLFGALLQGANFSNTNMTKADLSYTDLSEVNFSGANFSGAHFNEVNFSDANLRDSILAEVTLMKATLTNADLSNADLSYADLSYADLSYANLSYVNLSYADCKGADLSYADLSNADLSYADLSHVNFFKAKLINSKITDVVLYNIASEEWNITGIECEFIYTDEKRKKRLPQEGFFTKGEFEERWKHRPSFEFLLENNTDAQLALLVPKILNEIKPQLGLELELLNIKSQFAKFTVKKESDIAEAEAEVKRLQEENRQLGYDLNILQGRYLEAKENNALLLPAATSKSISMGDNCNIGVAGDAHHAKVDQSTINNYYPQPNEVEKVKEEIQSADIPEEHKKSILEMIEEHAIDVGNGILRSGIATIADSVKFYMTGAMIASFPFLSEFIAQGVQ